ncbi:MAG: hypothetical protein QOD38_2268 [Acidimicrobiaceae bacterium]
MWCLFALVFAGDAASLGGGHYPVAGRDLDALVQGRAAPALGVDASRFVAPTTTLPLPEAPPTTAPTGPADPPAPPDPPPLPLRPARLDADFPDPTIVWGDDRWYAFATNAGPRNVQLSTSTDLLTWTAPVDAAPMLPSWSQSGQTWAPAVAKIGRQWVLYVSIISVFGGHCIDRLVAATAGGPYAPVDGGPLVCNQTGGDGAIDPSATIVGGVPYLYWKAEGSRSQQLFGVALTPDGLAFVGQPRHLLTATAAWQQTGVENPSMIPSLGVDWLVYSGAYWATGRYAMGYARCDGPLGPCIEMTAARPWVATTGNVVGPGGGDVFTGPYGDRHLAYHAWSGGPGYTAGGRRLLHVEAIDVGSNGPSILDRSPTGAIAPVTIGPDLVSVTGEAIDPDTSEPIGLEVYLDGRLGARTAGRHGFGVQLDIPVDGPHRVCVIAIDDLEQTRPVLGCQDFTISSIPFGALDAVAPAVTGWAIAPSTTAPISVDVYVDGVYTSSATADLPRDDVASEWPAYGAGHGFSVAMPVIGPGPHTICVYAIVDDDQPAPQLGCSPL